MKAIIAGATGLVGTLLTEKLIENSAFSKVISISRRKLEIQNAKLEQVLISDLLQMKDKSQLLQGDIYFCCLGTTIKDAGSQEQFRKIDFEAIVEFAKIAKSYDAKSFLVISAMGANSKSSIFYNRVKGETEEALKNMKLQSVSIFRPGLLIGHRRQVRTGERFAMGLFQTLAPVLPARLEKTFATRADHLAERMIEAALVTKPGVQIIASKDI